LLLLSLDLLKPDRMKNLYWDSGFLFALATIFFGGCVP